MSEISEILMLKHSKEMRDRVLAIVLSEPDRIDELMDCFFAKEYRLCQRASWPIGVLGEKHPEYLLPYFGKMLETIKNPLHDAVVRNTLRSWSFMNDYPVEFEGALFDICFLYMTDISKPVAIRMFSLLILCKLARKYPELAEELIPTIEEHYPHTSPGFQSRAKKELKILYEMSN